MISIPIWVLVTAAIIAGLAAFIACRVKVDSIDQTDEFDAFLKALRGDLE